MDRTGLADRDEACAELERDLGGEHEAARLDPRHLLDARVAERRRDRRSRTS
jgi:hypothetical protein